MWEGFVEIDGIGDWQRRGWVQAGNLESVRPQYSLQDWRYIGEHVQTSVFLPTRVLSICQTL